MTNSSSRFNFGKIFVLGFGFLGISLLWSIYNDFVPILLQAGRPDFNKGAGIQGFGLGTTLTGFIMGLDNFAALFILPWIGGISDRLRTRIGRRKPFILIGAPLAAAAFVATPFLLGKPLGFFMAALIITLLAMDLFRTPVVAFMPDLTPKPLRSQANGIINFMGGMGGVVATWVGGTLFGVSPIAPFLLASGGMLIAQTILLLAVPEPDSARALSPSEAADSPESDTRSPAEDDVEDPALTLGLLQSLWKVIQDPDRSALRLLGAIAFWFLGQSAWEAWFTSYSVQHLHLAAGQAAVLKGTYSIAVLASAIPCGGIGAVIGRRKAILIGLLVFAASIAACFFLSDPVWMRLLLVSAGFGWMLVVVNSLPFVLDFAPNGREGTYTGLYYLASQTASFFGPMISGFVFEATGNNYRLLCIYTPVALLAAAFMVTGTRGGEKHGPLER